MTGKPCGLAMFLFAAILVFPSMSPSAQQAADFCPGLDSGKPSSARGVPLSRYLRPDGTLALPPEGIRGSIDPAGFQLASGPGEGPRF